MSNEEEILCENCGSPIHPCLPCEEVIMLCGNHTDSEYFRLLNTILETGRTKINRTGIDTIGVFGEQAKFDVCMDAFPILTTKKVFFKAIVHELLWFIRGDTNIKYLVDNDVHIWDEWAYKRYKTEYQKLIDSKTHNRFANYATDTGEWMVYSFEEYIRRIRECPVAKRGSEFTQENWKEAEFAAVWGELGEGTYGSMWRAFPCYENANIDPQVEYVDQLGKVVEKLKTNPDDRRMIVSAWNPYLVDQCALPPCHCLFHFNTEELTMEERVELYSRKYPSDTPRAFYDGYVLDDSKIPKRKLNLLLYQRSCDTFLGVPFNITSYSLLLALVAHCVGMEPGVFTHTYGDLHIYENHIKQVKTQLERTPYVLPKLWLNPKVTNLFDFKFEDIKLIDYKSHPTIKGAVAV